MDMKNCIFINRLNKISTINKNNPLFINKDLYKLIIKPESLFKGYEKTQTCLNLTKTKTTTIEPPKGLKLTRLLKLQTSLQNESWKPKPYKNFYKRGEKEKQPYGVLGGLEERVVQALVSMVLESIYSSIFSPNSYERPGKGIHDALKFIDQNYDGVVWALKATLEEDIFDNVNHQNSENSHIFIKLLEKKISDDRFIRLIWKLLGAGYINSKKPPILLGTPQPTNLFNPADIYLHELDMFMEQLSKNKATSRSTNRRTPPFKKVESEMRRVTRKLNNPGIFNPEERQKYIKTLRGLKNMSLKIRMYIKGNDRILYTRYGNHFIIGVAGSKALTLSIETEVKNYLDTLKLTLKDIKITPLRKSSAFFLGHNIQINTSVKYKRVRVRGRTPFTRRVTGKFVLISAPMDKIVGFLFEKNFCDRQGKPKHKTNWITQKDFIIIKNFNNWIYTVFGFYSGVHKKHALTRVWYIFKFSCAMTLAAKHSCSLSHIFEKHGALLKVYFGTKGEKQTCLYQPNLKKAGRIWQTGKIIPDFFKI